MKTVYKNKADMPYSMHDMRITALEREGENLKLVFSNGLVETKKPYRQLKGTVTLENVDFDFLSLHILSRNGEEGKFKGEKICGFEKIKSSFDEIEVVDEMYGYNKMQLGGYAYLNGKLSEVLLFAYFFGNMIYETEAE